MKFQSRSTNNETIVNIIKTNDDHKELQQNDKVWIALFKGCFGDSLNSEVTVKGYFVFAIIICLSKQIDGFIICNRVIEGQTDIC